MIKPDTLLQNRYRVARQIGHGGMGAVYVGTDERFRSRVAIKRTFFADPEMSKAFEREAHLLNHLRHAALPKVSDHFTEDAGQFLVMEYIEGSELSRMLEERGGAFPLADVLAWADELLDALDYLHTHQPPIIHRDIKPQNLKLTPRGQIVLLDFGLAKGMPAAEARSEVTASVFGYSRNYAPLEQMQGSGTDARSDLYSLAATLYHLMTGVLPVDALTRAGATIQNQLDPLRPAHLAHAQVPVSVGKILQRAMSQNAALRPASAAEMRAALRKAASNAGSIHARRATDAPAVHAQAQSALYEATVVEPAAQSPHSQTGSIVWPRGEMSVTGVAARRPQQSTQTHVAPPPHAQSSATAGVSPAKLLGVAIVVLLVACAAAGLVLAGRSGSSPAGSEAQTDARTDAPAATQPSSFAQTPSASNNTDSTPAPNQPTDTRASGETQSSDSQSAPATTEAAGNALTNSGAGSATAQSDTASAPNGTTTKDSSALVIRNSSDPGPRAAAIEAEIDARRKEEARREEEARRAEETRRAEEAARRAQESQSRPAQPPFPQDRFQPPPGGHPHPPPPGHRPPPPRP